MSMRVVWTCDRCGWRDEDGRADEAPTMWSWIAVTDHLAPPESHTLKAGVLCTDCKDGFLAWWEREKK